MKNLFWPHAGQNAPCKSVPSIKFAVINCYTDLTCLPLAFVEAWLLCFWSTGIPGFGCAQTKLTFECNLRTLILLFRLSICRRAHTLTVLFILTCALVYVTLLEETPHDTTYNTKRYGQHVVGSVFTFSTGNTVQRTREWDISPNIKLKWSDVARNITWLFLGGAWQVSCILLANRIMCDICCWSQSPGHRLTRCA